MRKIAKNIIAGLEDAIAYTKGDTSRGVLSIYTIPAINVKAIRAKTGLTQEGFCKVFAIKPRTLQDWEQQRKMPAGPARILLALIDQHPLTVKKTLKTLGHSFGEAKKKTTSKPQPKKIKSKSAVKKIGDPASPKSKLRKRLRKRV